MKIKSVSPDCQSRTHLIFSARSPMAMGFIKISRIPMDESLSREIFSLNPVHNKMGISGRIFNSFCESLSPAILGMAMSVMTRSKLWGAAEKQLSASILETLEVTLYPRRSSICSAMVRIGSSSSTHRIFSVPFGAGHFFSTLSSL